MDTTPRLFKSRAAWRGWLARNHDRSAGIWLAYFKRATGKTSVTYEEALQEALCFGWIDSVVRRIDEERYAQKYTPRKPLSIWSLANKTRVKKLIAEGRVAPPGLAKVRAAKRDGSWNKLDGIERIVEITDVPADLLAALKKEPRAREAFEKRPPSERKIWSYWVISAKKPETRTRRIAETVKRILAGRRPGM